MSKLTKVGSNVWVLPTDVVRVYYTDPVKMGNKILEGHVYVVLRGPGKGLFGDGPSDHYQTSDWSLARVERALGLRKWPDVREYLVRWHWALAHVWGQLRAGVGV